MSGRSSRRASRIVLVGQDRWAHQLYEGLKGSGLDVVAVSTGSARQLLSPASIRDLRQAALVVRVGFRPGARTPRGWLFDRLLNVTASRAVQAMYWIGTDVHRLVEDRRERHGATTRGGSAVRGIDHHLAGSEPLRRELKEVGVEARTIDFPSFVAWPPEPLPPLPESFVVLSYVPDFRSRFYGGDVLAEAARRRPAIKFVIMGGNGEWLADRPPNMHFTGWVSDPAKLLGECSCVVRIPEHDSVGATAAEGLLFGRPVLYSEPLEHTIRVDRSISSLLTELDELRAAHIDGSLGLNRAASAWAIEEFDPDKRFRRLAEWLAERMSDRGDR